MKKKDLIVIYIFSTIFMSKAMHEPSVEKQLRKFNKELAQECRDLVTLLEQQSEHDTTWNKYIDEGLSILEDLKKN